MKTLADATALSKDILAFIHSDEESTTPKRNEMLTSQGAIPHLRENSISEEVHAAEGSEHHPVSEPPGVVFLDRGLDGGHRPVGRQGESDKVADEGGKIAEDHVQSCDEE